VQKLLNFTEAASEHRAFAQELPRFVSAVRQMFSAEEIAAHLARIEHEQREFERDQREIERGQTTTSLKRKQLFPRLQNVKRLARSNSR
jgi:hypothetical protein